MQVFMSYFVL